MISHLIFDLDDTLYSQTTSMSEEISFRIKAYVAKYFRISFDEAVKIRGEGMKKYGTTLDFLQANGLTDNEDYFSFVHPKNELENLPFDENIRPLLESIKLPKVILTNSPSEHAERVLNFLNIRDLFHDTISDIRRNKLKGKPYDFSYKDAMNLIDGNIENTLFIDDTINYVKGFAKLGGTSVLVGKAELSEKDKKEYGSQILKIKDIYELPELLKKLNVSRHFDQTKCMESS